MEGGTYAEAIKVGFTPEQAGLFSRACCEIKNECWDYVLQEQRKQKRHKSERSKAFIQKWSLAIAMLSMTLTVGIGIGFAVGSVIPQ